MIDYQEQKTLEAICAHHGVADKPELVEHLARLLEWVHAAEEARHGGPPPPFLLVFESQLGLHTCPRRGQQEADRGLVAV